MASPGSVSSTSRSSSSAPWALSAQRTNLPDCRATWRPGTTLPQYYDGCVDNAREVPVAAVGHECVDGSRLVSFRGRQWGMTGGPISVVQGDEMLEDPAYLTAFEGCQPA